MDWPEQSPDLNQIENLWKTLGQNLIVINLENELNLWSKMQEEGIEITVVHCQNTSKIYSGLYEQQLLKTKVVIPNIEI